MIYLFPGERATLTCPFIFGNQAYRYSIAWSKYFKAGFRITSYFDFDEVQISNDGRELRLPDFDPMNNTASYQCQLRVYRCTYFDENNEFLNGCARGALYLPFYYGPVTSLRELGMI